MYAHNHRAESRATADSPLGLRPSLPDGTTVLAVLIFPTSALGPETLLGIIDTAEGVLRSATPHTFRVCGGLVTVLPSVRSADAYQVGQILRSRITTSLPDREAASIRVALSFVATLDSSLADAVGRVIGAAVADAFDEEFPALLRDRD